jgi:arylsulfatase A-like enzyme
MQRLISWSVGCLLVAAMLLAAELAAAKPNILVIVGDDMGYADVGFHGCKDIPTPNIDSLAKNGVRCSNGYVSGPYCSPTRAGLMTGRYPPGHGARHNGMRLDLKTPTLAEDECRSVTAEFTPRA